jgi:acetyl esterase/lipase
MLALLDVIVTSIKTLFSCLINRQKLTNRSWRGEFVVRLAKSLLTRSIGREFTWVRKRQAVLTMYSPELFKVKRQPLLVAGVPCIEIVPKSVSSPNKTLLYFHGGGYAVGSASGYQLMGAKLALHCQARVILVDYRLVPEHPLPAAQDDCYAVTLEYLKQKQGLPLILMGDSAGGALCLSTLKRLQAHRAETPYSPENIAACVLISPWLAPLSPELLSLENETSDLIDRAITDNWVSAFFQSENLRSELDFSHVDSLNIDKDIMPPVYLQAAGAEIFLRQNLLFAEQLQAGDFQVQQDIFEDQFHVFQTFSPLVPEAATALDKIGRFVDACS